MLNINKNSREYKDAFYEIFKSMQLSAAYVLYYDMDFSKKKVENFHKILTRHNDEVVNHIISEKMIGKDILKRTGFDCKKEAKSYSHKVKLKMYRKKVKQRNTATVVVAGSDAIETYLILSIYTLRLNYRFTKEKVYEFHEHLKKFCQLYADGLTDDHVVKYFDQECGLEITEED